MSIFNEIKLCKTETPPTEPVVQCLNCRKDFVWWLHPVQLCDECVDSEMRKMDVDK